MGFNKQFFARIFSSDFSIVLKEMNEKVG